MERENHFDRMASIINDRKAVITSAAMLTNGYHMHKGQWRKKRV